MAGLGSLIKLSKSMGALPDASNAAEDMAKRILELRAAGRSDEVTEEMMSAADDPYMDVNTPLDMSQAARMSRADEMGFDVNFPFYHRTSKDFDAFDLDKSQSGEGIFTGWNPENLPQRHNRKKEGDRILPLLLKRGNQLVMRESNLEAIRKRYDKNLPYLIEPDAANKLKDAGIDTVIADIPAPFGQTEEAVALDPKNLRSRFARFDPEFSNLRNLSASILSAIGFSGLAARLKEEGGGI
tara:strand:+ start:152 stop:874 length:723 start_codon:yes stop_codon:yes gene_type:complete